LPTSFIAINPYTQGEIEMFNRKSFTLAAITAASLFFAASAFAGGYDKKQGDIVDTAVAAGNFSTLAAALEAGGLVETLKSDGPFTVFAPTDEAFAKLPAGTVENLLLPQNRDKLVAILTYHVVPGKVKAADVVKLESAETANGSDVQIRVEQDTVFVNDARVVATDIGASNGVIHVVDTVILPN
jgi:uncharacterized surface protein with fasciclin (FAS1) repeats